MNLRSLESWKYLLRSCIRYPLPRYYRCPACGGEAKTRVSRKLWVTQLQRCSNCELLYRTPIDRPGAPDEYYQSDYESAGLTTRLPPGSQLDRLRASNFRGSDKDFSSYIGVLSRFGIASGARVLDYGASWGYGVFQLRAAGYEAEGFEVSRPRASLAREALDVRVETRIDSLRPPYDAIFSVHVIEHLPDPSLLFEHARALLRPGGVMLAFTPNGCLEYRQANQQSYDRHWGRDHPVYIDDRYLANILADEDVSLYSVPWRTWGDLEIGQANGRLDQTELLVAYRKRQSKATDA